MGRDGRLHTIPVHWVEYIPVSETSNVEVHVPKEEKDLTYEQRFRQMFEDFKDKKEIDKERLFRLSQFLVILDKKKKEE